MVLKFINEQMEALQIPYEFGEWTSEVQYPYFVGECTELEPTTEDGASESSFILTGFHRGDYITLEEIKNKIKKHFPSVHGLRVQTESGAIAAFYGGAFFVPTGEAKLRKIQINLKIKTWEGVL
jgi:hypothetical protein